MRANIDAIPAGVSISCVRIIGLIHAHGAMRSGEVARALGNQGCLATALVDRLVELGLVERSQGVPGDRRAVVLDLTGQGQRLAEMIFPS